MTERGALRWHLGWVVAMSVWFGLQGDAGFSLPERAALLAVGLVTLWVAAVRVGVAKLAAYPGTLAAWLLDLTAYGVWGALRLDPVIAVLWVVLLRVFVRHADGKDDPPPRERKAEDVALDPRWTWLG